MDVVAYGFCITAAMPIIVGSTLTFPC